MNAVWNGYVLCDTYSRLQQEDQDTFFGVLIISTYFPAFKPEKALEGHFARASRDEHCCFFLSFPRCMHHACQESRLKC
jgi:hypothetical protein